MKSAFLITAGPTREYLDPVRYFSNPSSGKMGYALARAARDRGARVVLVSGPVALRPPKGVRLVKVESAEEMRGEVMRRLGAADAVIMAAAVADFRPAVRLKKKLKKGERSVELRMVRTADILAEIGRKKGGRLVVGFAAETGDPLPEARRKLEEKNLDIVVANDVSRRDAGFASDFNRALLLDRAGRIERLPRMRKERLSRLIIRRCMERLRRRRMKASPAF